MIYLASVYSFEADASLMQQRYQYAARRTAEFLKLGYTIFSPINHCHPLSNNLNLPKDWEFWKKHDMNYIRASQELWVLMMPHWRESVGVNAEIKYASELSIPVRYFDCGEYSEEESDEKD